MQDVPRITAPARLHDLRLGNARNGKPYCRARFILGKHIFDSFIQVELAGTLTIGNTYTLTLELKPDRDFNAMLQVTEIIP